MIPSVRACNREYDRLVNVLTADIYITEPVNKESTISTPPDRFKFKAIWDTGATNTAITPNVVRTCGLIATGITKVNTPKGDMIKPTYLVGVWLPNKVCIQQLRVTECDVGGTDVLIGMDIISKGDFAVSNKDNKTNLSFRIPSIECTNYVNQLRKNKASPIKKVGRNDLCPCGSGKKYKHCCGR